MIENNEERTCFLDDTNSKINIPTYSFNFTNKIDESNCENKDLTKKDLLSKIKSLNFAITELAEYLDTHEDDKKALILHKKYANKLEELKEKYQKIYGPLTIYCPCNKWRWLEEPWPWEGGNL